MGKIGQAILQKLHLRDILNQNNEILLALKKQEGIQNELLKAEVFNSTIADSEWLRYKSFSPGRWAVDYALLYTLYRTLTAMKPTKIIEFGLGQSSKMIHQYAIFYQSKAITIEHDQAWIDFFRSGLEGNYDINIQLLDLATIEYNGFETLTYKNFNSFFSDEKFDIILVDAPFGSKRYSRSQIVDMAHNNLSDSFCIIIDDTERQGEKDTIAEVCKVLDEKKIKYYSTTYTTIKSHTVICSENLRFLTTL